VHELSNLGGQRGRGRPLSDSGAKARLYHAVKEAHLAHLITRVRHQMQFLRGFSVEMPMKSTTWLRAEKLP
jgi:hypothetical protein